MPRPIDQLKFVSSYTQLPKSLYAQGNPVGLKGSRVISINPDVAEKVGIDLCSLDLEKLGEYCGGHTQIPGANPIAMKYTGHQFGSYNPDLGDGRGLLLGEIEGEGGHIWDLHLKGSGKTQFSRFGDGKAVLRSSIREYLVSAAMTGLKIPSTLALCLTASDQMTMRNGMESCATVLRITPSHIRFGHFEYLYYTKQHEELKVLADHVITRYMPDFADAEFPYQKMFSEVLERSAKLVAAWQVYGFVHGVLNTDNMSIIGESFDYGPFSFLDDYDPEYVSNKNDHEARYAFKNQPGIVQWNLSALAQALLPIIELDFLKEELERFWPVYHKERNRLIKARLGLTQSADQNAESSEATSTKETKATQETISSPEKIDALIAGMEQMFIDNKVDITRFYRVLSEFPEAEALAELEHLVTNTQQLGAWYGLYTQCVAQQANDSDTRQRAMCEVNPKYILRNYMAEEVIREAELGHYTRVAKLLNILRSPFEKHKDDDGYDQTPPNWAAAINLTCSS